MSLGVRNQKISLAGDDKLRLTINLRATLKMSSVRVWDAMVFLINRGEGVTTVGALADLAGQSAMATEKALRVMQGKGLLYGVPEIEED